MDLKGIEQGSHIDFTVQICDIFYKSAPIFYNTALFTGMNKLQTRHLTALFTPVCRWRMEFESLHIL